MKYTKQDVLRLVQEEDVVYGYFRNDEECGDHFQPAGKGTG